MDKIKIQVNYRQEKGKQKVKKIRIAGGVPAVVYSEDTNIVLSVPLASLKVLKSMHFSENSIINMEIDDGTKHKSMPVIIKATQYHPLTEQVIHIDFLKVSLKEKIKVHIPIILKGENKIAKEEGAAVEQILRELEIEGLPLDIPKEIEVDISQLAIGHSIHAENINVGDKVKIVSDKAATVVTLVVKKEEPEEEAVAEEEGAPQEPEVIKEKKDAPQDQAKEGKGEKIQKKEK